MLLYMTPIAHSLSPNGEYRIHSHSCRLSKWSWSSWTLLRWLVSLCTHLAPWRAGTLLQYSLRLRAPLGRECYEINDAYADGDAYSHLCGTQGRASAISTSIHEYEPARVPCTLVRVLGLSKPTNQISLGKLLILFQAVVSPTCLIQHLRKVTNYCELRWRQFTPPFQSLEDDLDYLLRQLCQYIISEIYLPMLIFSTHEWVPELLLLVLLYLLVIYVLWALFCLTSDTPATIK